MVRERQFGSDSQLYFYGFCCKENVKVATLVTSQFICEKVWKIGQTSNQQKPFYACIINECISVQNASLPTMQSSIVGNGILVGIKHSGRVETVEEAEEIFFVVMAATYCV